MRKSTPARAIFPRFVHRFYQKLYDSSRPRDESRDCCKKAYERRMEESFFRQRRLQESQERSRSPSKPKGGYTATYYWGTGVKTAISPSRELSETKFQNEQPSSARVKYHGDFERFYKTEFSVFRNDCLDITVTVKLNRPELRKNSQLPREIVEDLRLKIDLSNMEDPQYQLVYSENQGELREISLNGYPQDRNPRSSRAEMRTSSMAKLGKVLNEPPKKSTLVSKSPMRKEPNQVTTRPWKETGAAASKPKSRQSSILGKNQSQRGLVKPEVVIARTPTKTEKKPAPIANHRSQVRTLNPRKSDVSTEKERKILPPKRRDEPPKSKVPTSQSTRPPSSKAERPKGDGNMSFQKVEAKTSEEAVDVPITFLPAPGIVVQLEAEQQAESPAKEENQVADTQVKKFSEEDINDEIKPSRLPEEMPEEAKDNPNEDNTPLKGPEEEDINEMDQGFVLDDPNIEEQDPNAEGDPNDEEDPNQGDEEVPQTLDLSPNKLSEGQHAPVLDLSALPQPNLQSQASGPLVSLPSNSFNKALIYKLARDAVSLAVQNSSETLQKYTRAALTIKLAWKRLKARKPKTQIYVAPPVEEEDDVL
eukprot:TRINITY_DN9042_c0_g1_i1.p1 TRINITY_DN9042_c0_g1~~TRINITY_DN9042_c0_g1_i1.p1  ORF type:complete len:592 (-),score=122.03 TRINITY_DN9042_c0_g1_i1:68-1843(-)